MDCLAIGSLPHKNPDEALQLVRKYFNEIPFWAQLVKFNKNEDMRMQFLEGISSFFSFKDFKFSNDDKNFQAENEHFLDEYQKILKNPESELLEKYAISEKFSSTFGDFVNIIKGHKAAKTQITGCFTLSAMLFDYKGDLALYNKGLRDYIVKFLTLKALWQVKKIKQTGAKPIIFLDEPLLSKYKDASVRISESEVISIIGEIVDKLHDFGAVVGLHCCGECDWSLVIKTGVDILSFDAYKYAEQFSKYHKSIAKFLDCGGKIAWGIVPTVNFEALEHVDLKILTNKFDEAVTYLTNKGISEKLITENSYVTPSCGAGSLTEELAQKAMRLTRELSDNLKERYNDN